MQEESTARFPTIAVRVAALWLAVGAIFKLVAGSPNDLPPVVKDFALFGWDPSAGTILELAISIELVFVFTALLRPRWGWPWLAAQFVVFLGVLTTTVLGIQRAALEPMSFKEAMFDGSCGCFGGSVEIAPGIMMIADVLVLLVMLASRPWRGRLGHWGPEWLPTGFACLALALPAMTRATPKKPTAEPAAVTDVEVDGATGPDAGAEPDVEPAPQGDWWEGLTVDQLDYVEIKIEDWNEGFVYDLSFLPYPQDPEKGYAPFWTVMGLDEELALLPIDATFVLYRDACEHCAAHIQELATNDTGARALVFVHLPEDNDAQDLVQLDQVYPEGTPHVSRLRLPEGVPYIFTTPGDFQVDGGMVSAPREGIGR